MGSKFLGTTEAILNHLHDEAWVKDLLRSPSLNSRLERLATSAMHSTDDRGNEEERTDLSKSKAIILWRFPYDDDKDRNETWGSTTHHKWREMAVSEEGYFFVRHNRSSSGVARSDFEAYASVQNHDALDQRISGEGLEEFAEMIADKLIEFLQGTAK
jgi:hypothetical protein